MVSCRSECATSDKSYLRKNNSHGTRTSLIRRKIDGSTHAGRTLRTQPRSFACAACTAKTSRAGISHMHKRDHCPRAHSIGTAARPFWCTNDYQTTSNVQRKHRTEKNVYDRKQLQRQPNSKYPRLLCGIKVPTLTSALRPGGSIV